MSFNGKEGGQIDLETVQKAVRAYKSSNPGAHHAHFFGKDCIKDLLSQEGAMGIRIWLGNSDDDQLQLFLVAADENESNLLPGSKGKEEGGDFIIVNHSRPCPPYCNGWDPLNE